jgi:TRAP-type C4-dicarboxylate transport system permease small subunit
MMTFPLANSLPESSGDGYVAAAYIVFFVLLLIYVAIMALRLTRNQKDIDRLSEEVEAHRAALQERETERIS